jgi:nucleotide-binding universal stress UspA family protein
MSELGRNKAQRDALHDTGEVLHPTRYGEAVNRYLTAAGYDHLPRPVRRPTGRTPPAPRFTGVVVVGVDDSPDSYIAVDHAAIEAELHGWDLRLVHVQYGPGAKYPARDRGARLLEHMTERVHAHSGSVAVTSRLATGAAATGLLAEATDTDLVVVGRRHGMAGAAFGRTVGDRVAAHHLGPVMVVRIPGWPPGADFAHRPIIAGLDDSPGSAAVRSFAVTEAKARGCDVILLHAADDAGLPYDRIETIGGVQVHHRKDGADPVAALVDASDKAAAVVLGRQGRSRVTEAVLGSVSRTVLQHARCPVFLVGQP